MAEAAQQHGSVQLDEADMQGLWDLALHRDDGQQEPGPPGKGRRIWCSALKAAPCSWQLDPSCTAAGCARTCATALRSCAVQACTQGDCYLCLCLPVILLIPLGSCCHNILQALVMRSAGQEGGASQAAPAPGHPVSAGHMSATPFAAPEAQQGPGHQPGPLQQPGAPQRHQDLHRKPEGDMHRVPTGGDQAGHAPLSVDDLSAASVS